MAADDYFMRMKAHQFELLLGPRHYVADTSHLTYPPTRHPPARPATSRSGSKSKVINNDAERAQQHQQNKKKKKQQQRGDKNR